MSGSTIFTDQHAPNGQVIRYNVDDSTREVAAQFARARLEDEMMQVPNEEPGGEPIFVNPDHVATVSPTKEKED